MNNKYSKLKSYFEEPHISYSQINCYKMCPLQYRFRYVDCLIPEFIPAALTFGSTIHEALAFYYRGLRDNKKPYSLEGIIDVFETDWHLANEVNENIKFDNGDNKNSLKDKGIEMLKTFYESVQPGEVIAVEVEFKLASDNNNGNSKPLPLPIVGQIDLIEKDREGYIVAVDHKTAARKYSDNKVDDDLQLTIYTCALSRSKLANGDKEFYARFDVLTKTKSPELVSYYTSRNDNDFRKLMKLVREICYAIDQGVFFPNPGWQCSGCQYATACKKW